MIPKTLFLAFLSLRLPEQLPLSTQDIESLDIATTPQKAALAAQNPILVEHYQDVGAEQFNAQERVTIDFDALPSGDWDSKKIINGNVQLWTDEGYTRIWSIPDAFPNIKLPGGKKHAWGAYPTGHNITVKFTDGAHTNIARTFGWVVNGELTSASWETQTRKDGKFVAGSGGTISAGSLATINSGSYGGDEEVFIIKNGVASGLLLITGLAYDN